MKPAQLSGVKQVVVRDLEGRSLCLQFNTESISGAEVLQRLCVVRGIPASHVGVLRLSTGTQEISVTSSLRADKDGFFPSCRLSVRLLGGKGGFGSLLRGSATRAGQKKTTNFDACRDMSGRRLRHVNAEKKLKEWRHEAKERRLEKLAEVYMKKLAKEQKKTVEDVTVVADIRMKSAETMDRVAEAVQQAMKAKGKRELTSSEEEYSVKKAKIMELLEGIEVEEEGDSEEEDEDECEEEDEERAGNEEEEEEEEEERVGEGAGPSGSGRQHEAGPSARPTDAEPHGEVASVPPTGGVPSAGRAAPGLPGLTASGSSSPSSSSGKSTEEAGTEEKGSQGSPAAPHVPDALEETAAAVTAGPLDWDKISSSSELEALGLERLKVELQQRGLKCGGTLQERAARMYLLKHCALGDLDKKYFAAQKKGKSI